MQYLHTNSDLIPLSVDDHVYQTKPDDWHEVTKRLRFTEFTPTELRDHILSGKCVCGGVFQDDHRNNDAWICQRLLCLDFDRGAPQEVLERCIDLTVEPLLIYETYRHSPEAPRFRVCFIFDGLVFDPKVHRLFGYFFKRLFPEVDGSCFDQSRLLAGTNKNLISFNPTAKVSVEVFVPNCIDRLVSDHGNNASRERKRIYKDTGLNLDAQLPYLLNWATHTPVSELDDQAFLTFHSKSQKVSKSGRSHIYIDGKDQFYSSQFLFGDPNLENLNRFQANKTQESIDGVAENEKLERLPPLSEKELAELSTTCGILKDFHDGRDVQHSDKLILRTNLQRFRGGAKLFDELHTKQKDYDRHKERKYTYSDKFTRNHRPHGCHLCSRYSECNPPGKNLLALVPRGNRTVAVKQIKSERELVPVEETRERLVEVIAEALNDTEPNIHVIKCDCGVGKTEALLNQTLQDCFVAAPTHRLKEEIATRATNHDDFFVWPKRPELPQPWHNWLKDIDDSGHGNSLQILSSYLTSNDREDNDALERVVRDYITSCDTVKEVSKVLGTHAKAISLSNPNIKTIIFDEDPMPSLMAVSEIKAGQFNRLHKLVEEDPDFQGIEALMNYLHGIKVLTPCRSFPEIRIAPKVWDKLSRKQIKFTSPIVRMFDADVFVKDYDGDIHTLKFQKLSPSVKYVILSATADETVYRDQYGDRLRFHDLSGTQKKATMIQHTKNGYSRTKIQKMGTEAFVKAVKETVEKYELDGIITFKAYQEVLQAAGVKVYATFGNLLGLDSFRGNLGVFGTPHKPQELYGIYSLALSPEKESITLPGKPTRSRVKRDEFSYMLSAASTDPKILAIQQWLIESELVQAVSRCRPVQNNCKVVLFSDFPIKGFKLAE